MIDDFEYYGYPGMIWVKYGKEFSRNFQLTKDTAKEFYFLIECNTALFCKRTGIDFYSENFTVETLLSWNEEFILSSIEECKMNITKGLTNKTFIETVNRTAKVLKIYVKNRIVIKSIIDYMEFFINNLGCFMFFRTHGENIDDHTLYNLWEKILFKNNLNSMFVKDNLTSIVKFHDADAEGFMPNLIYQGYYDLLEEFVDRILALVSKKYDDKSDVMTKLNLWNGGPCDSNKEDLDFYIDYIREYLKTHTSITI